ncbi:MAG TPA: hypothetical protein VF269_09105 [Rhodanobacteraceae bacterium]
MIVSECIDTGLLDRTIITRSDHAPSDCERYGDWARKFFGCGCHQAFKDGPAVVANFDAVKPRTSTRH